MYIFGTIWVLSFLLISYSWSSCLRSREDISPCCCMCIVSLKSSPPKFPPVWVQLILMDWQHYEMGSAVCCLQLPRSRGTTLILSWIKHKSHLALKVGDSSRNYADPFLNQQKRIKTTLEGCQLSALQGTCPKWRVWRNTKPGMARLFTSWSSSLTM